MRRVAAVYIGSAVACGVLFAGCGLLKATSPVEENSTPAASYTRALDAAIPGYWDEVGPNLQLRTGTSAKKWHITSKQLVEDTTRLLPASGDTVSSPLFANNGKIGYVSVLYGEDVFSPAYDYTVWDTLGAMYLLVRWTGTTAATPVLFSDVTGANWLTGAARGFRIGSATSNLVDTVPIDTVPVDTTPVDTSHNPGTGYASIISGSYFGWTGYDGANAAYSFKLVRIDGASGTVTPVGGSDFFTALVYHSDGRLFAVSDEIHLVNPATGTTTKIAALTHSDTSVLAAGAAFSSANVLYVANNNGSPTGGRQIFTVNLTTGVLALVGSAQYVGTSAIEFDSRNTLYAGAVALIKISTVNAATIATVGSFSSSVWMDQFRCISDETAIGLSGNTTMTLESINLATGATTTLRTLAYRGVNGFTPARQTTTAAKKATAATLAKHGIAPSRSLAELIALEKRFKSGQ